MEPVETACVCTSLRMTARSIARLYDSALAAAGLRAAGYSILARLDEEGPFTVGDLAARLALERTTCTRELRPLRASGLVELTVGDDRRRRNVRITPAGTERLQQARPHWRRVQRRVTATFGVDETTAVIAGLRGLLGVGLELSATRRP